jgi:hypothetical protein
MNKMLMSNLVASLLMISGMAHAAGTAELDGFWAPLKKIDTLLTTEGKTPPLNAEGKQIYDQHMAEAKAGQRDFDIERKCLPLGLTRLMAESSFELFQAKQEAGLLFEWNRTVHVAYLRSQHDRDKHELQYAYPYYNGHSIAYTKGNTLVFDTIYFNEDNTLDKSGLPHSEDLHVTQSLKLQDANTLVNVVTIEDAKYYSKPWQTTFTYKRLPQGTYLKEDSCTERLGIKSLDSAK